MDSGARSEHGLAKQTNSDHAVMELCLAHRVGSQVRASLQSERSAKQEASPHATLERLHDAGASFQSRFPARLILPCLCSPLPIHGGGGNPPIPALLVRGGSISLNSLQAVDKWLSALVMPLPGLAWAGCHRLDRAFARQAMNVVGAGCRTPDNDQDRDAPPRRFGRPGDRLPRI